MVVKKGEIWWASLEEPRSSEPGFRRPVVIISSNEFNKSKIQTVIVAAITSNVRLSEAPGNFKLTKTSAGLNRESVVNVSQLLTLDKTFLNEKSGKLNAKQIQLLNYGLQLVLNV
jgi:mRNA interferase MazF